MQREFNQNLSRWRKAVIRYKMEASEASAQLRKIIRRARGDRNMIERLTEKYGRNRKILKVSLNSSLRKIP